MAPWAVRASPHVVTTTEEPLVSGASTRPLAVMPVPLVISLSAPKKVKAVPVSLPP